MTNHPFNHHQLRILYTTLNMSSSSMIKYSGVSNAEELVGRLQYLDILFRDAVNDVDHPLRGQVKEVVKQTFLSMKEFRDVAGPETLSYMMCRVHEATVLKQEVNWAALGNADAAVARAKVSVDRCFSRII